MVAFKGQDHTYVKPVDSKNKSKGRGAFARVDLDERSVIYSTSKPFLSALESARLDDTCYYCCFQPKSGVTNSQGQSGSRGPGVSSLKLCTGCRVVRYCGSKCQKSSWTHQGHKFECGIFKNLYPRVLPEHMRAVINYLLCHKNGLRSDYADVEDCPSHVEAIMSPQDDVARKLYQMAQATLEFAKPKLEFGRVLEFYCRMGWTTTIMTTKDSPKLKVNSITQMTPFFDPMGLCFDPQIAKFNHSCHPNAYIRFVPTDSGNANCPIEVRPLKRISKDEEITISYIEDNQYWRLRQKELQERYFFTCECEKCAREVKEESDSGPTMRSVDAVQSLQKRVMTLVDQAETYQFDSETESSTPTPVQMLREALQILHSSWSSSSSSSSSHTSININTNTTTDEPNPKSKQVATYPYPQTLQKLIVAFIDAAQFEFAACYAIYQFFDVDALVYHQHHHHRSQQPTNTNSCHPIRLVHTFTLLRLLNYVFFEDDDNNDNNNNKSQKRENPLRKMCINKKDVDVLRAHVANTLVENLEEMGIDGGDGMGDVIRGECEGTFSTSITEVGGGGKGRGGSRDAKEDMLRNCRKIIDRVVLPDIVR